jgi:regulator of CtrA degradation
MQVMSNEIRLSARLVDSLYVEAMVLADEVRAYFDEHGRAEREALPPLQRVAFSCESLKVTTRLMHVIAWLLTRRAVEHGEISVAQARAPSRRLGLAADSDLATLAILPDAARSLIDASRDLYSRVERLDQDIDLPTVPVPSPARGLLTRLERAF